MLMGKVDRWDAGVERARAAVLDGSALAQLELLIRTQNRDPEAGLARLKACIDGD